MATIRLPLTTRSESLILTVFEIILDIVLIPVAGGTRSKII